jgi:hypothetical protein
MSQQNRKRQHHDEQQEEKENENISSIVEINRENLEMIRAHGGNAITSNQSGNGPTGTIGGHENGKDLNELEIVHLKVFKLFV